MKKIIAIGLTCLALPLYASDTNTWYFGGQYSAQKISSAPDRDIDSLGLISGYQINDNLSVEARFNHGLSDYSDNISVIGYGNQQYKEELDKQISLLLKLSFPISSVFDIYGLAGFASSKYEITTSSSRTDIDGNTTVHYPHVIKHTQKGATYGVGINYQVSSSFDVYADYQLFDDLKVGSGDGESWKGANIGVKFKF